MSDAGRRLDALIQAGLALARSAPSGRVGLARAAAAIEEEWIPRPWGDALISELAAASRTAREPVPAREVERALRDAWGAKPADELDDLDLEPVAVTPIAQVHRGVLDGQPVAVKVARPGLARSVRQDLVALDGLARPLSAAFPALDAGAVLRELRERLLEELDLEHEAAVQRSFHRALRNHPVFVVPAPVTALSRPDVLVSAWVDGVPLAAAPDRDAAAARLVTFAIGALRWGTAHADIGPGDALVTPDGRLAILDFGAARRVAPERAEGMRDVVEAFAAGDGAALGSALAALGALPAGEGERAREVVAHALGVLGQPGVSRLDSAAVVAARDRLDERARDVFALVAAGSLPPEDLWPQRGVASAFATVARAGASADWLAVTLAAVRDGWDAAV